ncbi:hypothetical protein L5G28_08930 [Gordonia sp. HY285]|uniref:WS/DGAT domain-containing protein n=1 Tax=Gordonia liuliyuniae TaxID=2911517 RepID=UPI001F18C334|nr:WS/DGAT domain-containing protein [Gordonia liuliyuniae]MCF8610277.1 hypothetical protein [Gordonia liuliyuniae]
MAPADAAMYWASQVSANDQFLLFAFSGDEAATCAALVSEVRRRAAAIVDLHLTVETVPGDLDFPRWVPAPVSDDAIVGYPGPYTWDAVLKDVAALSTRSGGDLWRVHIFDRVTGVPDADSLARVAVLQISHALGDGRRVSAIARALFGGSLPEPARDARVAVGDRTLAAVRGGMLVGPHLVLAAALGFAAWAAPVPEATAAPTAATRANTAPGDRRVLRTLTVPSKAVRSGGHSVTVGVLAVLAEVLPDVLDASRREARAEVTVAFGDDPGAKALARNRFQTASVPLHADEMDRRRRAALIAAELGAVRRRVDSPGFVASRRAAASAPAVLGATAARLSADAPQPATVSGWTVVSSVNRGAADLTLAGGRVLFTAGFPALSAAHSLTHGVHGIGDAVTISVCAGAPIADDVDEYVAALSAAFAFAG